MADPFDVTPYGIKKTVEEWVPHQPKLRNIPGWKGRMCVDCGLHVEVHPRACPDCGLTAGPSHQQSGMWWCDHCARYFSGSGTVSGC